MKKPTAKKTKAATPGTEANPKPKRVTKPKASGPTAAETKKYIAATAFVKDFETRFGK